MHGPNDQAKDAAAACLQLWVRARLSENQNSVFHVCLIQRNRNHLSWPKQSHTRNSTMWPYSAFCTYMRSLLESSNASLAAKTIPFGGKKNALVIVCVRRWENNLAMTTIVVECITITKSITRLLIELSGFYIILNRTALNIAIYIFIDLHMKHQMDI